MGWSPFSVGSQQPLGTTSCHTAQILLCFPCAVHSTGLPWPTELVEEVISIVKQHEKVLDILISACSLLLRVLGQGGQSGGVPPS